MINKDLLCIEQIPQTRINSEVIASYEKIENAVLVVRVRSPAPDRPRTIVCVKEKQRDYGYSPSVFLYFSVR